MQAMIINQDYWTRMKRRGTSTILKMANEKKMLHQSQLLNATIRKERVNLDPMVSTEDQDWTTILETSGLSYCIRPIQMMEQKTTLWRKQSTIYFGSRNRSEGNSKIKLAAASRYVNSRISHIDTLKYT